MQILPEADLKAYKLNNIWMTPTLTGLGVLKSWPLNKLQTTDIYEHLARELSEAN